MNHRLSDRAFWPFAFLGLVGVRIPYLLSPNYVLDGDEAILGLMARHLAELSDVSVFFWGQAYGFALLETLPAAGAFQLFGAASRVLSLTMLGLFLLGLWLYDGAFRRLTRSRGWGRVLVLGMGLLPVWIIWSFKARGGYLTAFVLGGLLLRLLAARGFTLRQAVLAGGVAGLLFLAQPLWFAAFLPLLFLPFAHGAGGKEAVGMALSAVAVAGILFFGFSSVGYWRPEVLGAASFSSLLHLPETLYRMFTGFFYLDESRATPSIVAGVAFVAVVGWLLLVLALGRRFLERRDRFAGLLSLALLGSVLSAGILKDPAPRYLLQSSVLFMAALAFWLGRRPRPLSRGWKGAAACGLVALTASALFVPSFRPLHPDSEADLESGLRTLVHTLEERGVEGVYSMDALLQWQILFYSGESLPARFASPVDRRPEYPRRVDAALAAGEPVALVGTRSQAESLLRSDLAHRVEPVGEVYFILMGVSRPVLEAVGFAFLSEPAD